MAGGKTPIKYGTNRNIFRQGEPADSVFYLRRGKVKLAVTSKRGEETILAKLLRPVKGEPPGGVDPEQRYS